MLTRRTLLAGAIAGVGWPLMVEAQQAGKVFRVGWLGTEPSAQSRELFLENLRDLGYVEGRNIKIEYRFAKGNVERLPVVAAQLAGLNVDVILAVSQPAVQAAQQATTTIPIVMFGVADPVATGLVANLARPGGNITGLSQLSPELSAKQLALLKELIPGLSRLAVFVIG